MVPAAGCASQRPYRLNALLRGTGRGRPRGVDGRENESPGVFDGFSVCGNDLTQLAPGLGRDDSLVRGEEGLKVNMMAELPGNVFLADEFPDIFCGFSFVAPALCMRLALGLGRDDSLAGVRGGLKMGMMAELPAALPGRRIPGCLLWLLNRWPQPHTARARPRPRRRPGGRQRRPQGEHDDRAFRQRLPGRRVPGHLLRILHG